MDNTIRRNTNCIIGLPRCDFVFSSARTCFIAYGFSESTLEMQLIGRLLEERGIQTMQAAGKPVPGQNAFCLKICSKIITSQFCIAIVNNEERDGQEIPNANVNMEYGLMLGFNKYVIPFQKESQKLPFNTAPLDTVKYTAENFERKAAEAIDVADAATRQDSPPPFAPDQILEAFLLSKRSLVAAVDHFNPGHKNLFAFGHPLGFFLLHDFAGTQYRYFGNFTNLRTEVIVWRAKMLTDIISQRLATMRGKIIAGSPAYAQAIDFCEIVSNVQIWILVTTQEAKERLQKELHALPHEYNVFCLDDIQNELKNIDKPISLAPAQQVDDIEKE